MESTKKNKQNSQIHKNLRIVTENQLICLVASDLFYDDSVWFDSYDFLTSSPPKPSAFPTTKSHHEENAHHPGMLQTAFWRTKIEISCKMFNESINPKYTIQLINFFTIPSYIS